MENRLFIRNSNWNFATGIVVMLVLGILFAKCIKVSNNETRISANLLTCVSL